MRDEGDVAGQDPSTDGVGQRASNYEVYFVHRLGGEPDAAVDGVQEPVVERVEVVGAQSPQPDSTEGGQHVALDVAVIPGVGGSGEHDPLAGQPLAGEVSAEGQ